MDLKKKIAVATLSLSVAGGAAIKMFEGTKTEAYQDVANVSTICTGHIKGVYKGQKASLSQCEEWFKEDTSNAGKRVAKLVKQPITQAQYDALISFTFNLGSGSLAKSTLLKKINAGQCVAAGNEFMKWNKVKVRGKLVPSKGLTKRREYEKNLWLSGC